MNGTVYLPEDAILLTDVGDSFPPGDTNNPTDPGPSLVCVTSNVNTMCCRGSDHPGDGPVGNWFYPDGIIVLGNSANPNGDFLEVHTPNKYVLTGRELMSCPQLESTPVRSLMNQTLQLPIQPI